MLDNLEAVGSVIADDVSPSFESFRFKANAFRYVFPGTLLGTWVDIHKRFLIGRVSSAIEINPHESPERSKVREAMDMPSDYPSEDFSTTIFRVYEVEIIEEAIIQHDVKITIEQPSNMPKAGAEVFQLTDSIVAEALGFETSLGLSLCLGTTQHSSAHSDGEEPTNNVMLKREAIQRHIFVGGTTGSGKSFSTGIILEEINRLGLPIIILDSQKEYAGVARELGGLVLVPGKDYSVRLSSLTETEILELVPTLRSARVGYDLLAFTFIRLKREIVQGRRENFGLEDVLDGMRMDAPKLEVKDSSLNLALGRVRYSIERHSYLGGSTNWVELLKWNQYQGKTPILNIDCSGLDQTQLQLIVGATLRELQTLRKVQTIPPYVSVLDEAHLLVPEGEGSACKQVIREGVRIGRHFGICMILITQSPVDIDKKTIRQCNTRLIFALEPDQLDAIRGVRADATDDMLKRLPKMPVGTCLLSGTYETVKHAIPIKIRSDRKTAPGGATPNIFEEVELEWQT
ncbi:MAG: ATP-binding protein [Chloroflexota bacterium]|nr:ATP-binding protein [Chloroflexota bacterium]